MKLDWHQHDKPAGFGLEYRAWGVQSPYRILVTDHVSVASLGTGRVVIKPRVVDPGTAFAAAMVIAQRWEDADQAVLTELGY